MRRHTCTAPPRHPTRRSLAHEMTETECFSSASRIIGGSPSHSQITIHERKPGRHLPANYCPGHQSTQLPGQLRRDAFQGAVSADPASARCREPRLSTKASCLAAAVRRHTALHRGKGPTKPAMALGSPCRLLGKGQLHSTFSCQSLESTCISKAAPLKGLQGA